MVMGLLFTIVGDIFSPAERGRYQGLFAAVWGVASIFGPTLGGWLTDHWSWRACFWVNLPVGADRGRGDLLRVPAHEAARLRRAGSTGPASRRSSARVVPLLLALTWATQYGWTSTRVDSLLALSAVMLGAFLSSESKAAEPVIPLSLFRDPIIAICSVCAFVLGMGMFGVIIYLPLFMQGVLGVSATQSGNLLTPLMMGAVVGSIVGGQTVSRTGTLQGVALVGSMLVAIGHDPVRAHGASTPRGSTSSTAMIVSGLGMGLLQPVYTLAVQNVAPRRQMGAATSSTIFFRSIGSTVGVAAFGIDHADALSRDLRAGDAGARAGGGAAVFLEPAAAGAGAAADGSGVRPRSRAARRCCRRCSTTCAASLASGLHLIFVCSAVIMALAVLLHLCCAASRCAPGRRSRSSRRTRHPLRTVATIPIVVVISIAVHTTIGHAHVQRTIETEAHHRAAGNAYRSAADIDAGDRVDDGTDQAVILRVDALRIGLQRVALSVHDDRFEVEYRSPSRCCLTMSSADDPRGIAR